MLIVLIIAVPKALKIMALLNSRYDRNASPMATTSLKFVPLKS